MKAAGSQKIGILMFALIYQEMSGVCNVSTWFFIATY
jgi:hypothetical protein